MLTKCVLKVNLSYICLSNSAQEFQKNRYMKKLIMILSLLFATTVFSQQVKPTYEKVDDNLIKATFYYDNGEVNQIGFFKNEKPHGEWISYDTNGKKLSKGNYELGIKKGKWFFWDGNELSEVSYSNNEIADIKVWNEGSTVVSAFRK